MESILVVGGSGWPSDALEVLFAPKRDSGPFAPLGSPAQVDQFVASLS